MRWAELVARMEAMKYPYKILVGKHQGRSLRPGRRWEVILKMILRQDVD
jgi:hypothetical protein